MNHIELFAGCGGLSLGLKSVGFDLLMANELSPMAAETFAYNFFGEDDLPASPERRKTKWLSSQFAPEETTKRLRENPHEYPPLGKGHSDVQGESNINGKLVVGSIIQLNDWLEQNLSAKHALQNGFDGEGVDLVSGGPPCQSFSMAGLREFSNHRNVLPWEFARFVEMVKPRFAILENVTGILRPFRVNGVEVHAWFEVAKAFAEVGYVPLCLHVNAKFAGVAQNRPRFVMLSFRKDVYDLLKPNFNEYEKKMLNASEEFFELMDSGVEPAFDKNKFSYYDAAKPEELKFFTGTFLNPLIERISKHCSVKEAIDDLRTKRRKEEGRARKAAYVKRLEEYFSSQIKAPRFPKLQNNEPRNNGEIVQRRFRIYQVLQLVSNTARNEACKVLSGDSTDLSNESAQELMAHSFGTNEKNLTTFSTKTALIDYLRSHPTKKQTQRALDANSPAPAALSIPDDACHYHEAELRTLTVREMARIQSFPDSFVFRSKVTTGGQSRKFEVPQYTQVGNAVPPLLGRALGLVIETLLKKLPDPRAKPTQKRKQKESKERLAESA